MSANHTYKQRKQKLTLSIDKSVVDSAKSTGVNISKIVENYLKSVNSSPDQIRTGVAGSKGQNVNHYTTGLLQDLSSEYRNLI